ncbi:MAG: type VII toxin-antitoxin system HepT family RNase toxin [Planctomycetota bacterium]
MPTPPDDILLNKAAIIERCVRRMLEEAGVCPQLDDFTHVDALTLNIERACQATIDMAMHVVADRHLGVPQSTADAFILLERAGLIGGPLAAALCGMVGFRNVAAGRTWPTPPETADPNQSASSVRSVTSISRSITSAGDSCGKFVSTTSFA